MNEQHSARPTETGATFGLRPCPFCGGQSAFGNVRYSARMIKEQEWDQDTFHFVNCIMCGVSNQGLTGWKSERLAAEHWNRRAP